MRIALAILFLLITIAVTFMGFIVLIATGKEGIAQSDLGLIGGLCAIYLAIICVWFWIYKKSQHTAIKAISVTSMLITAFQLSINSLVLGYIFKGIHTAKLVSTQTIISNYHESFITWPTLPYPVGLKVEFTIKDGAKLAKHARFGDVLLWMGPNELVNFETLYASAYQNFAYLKPALFNRMIAQSADSPVDNDLIIVRYLYPNIIDYIESPNAFCKHEYGQTVIERYFFDSHLNGILFWHQSVKTAEIRAQLQQILRKQSRFENNPEDWTKMHQQFSDEVLFSYGFKPCQLSGRKHCYCKNEAQQAPP